GEDLALAVAIEDATAGDCYLVRLVDDHRRAVRLRDRARGHELAHVVGVTEPASAHADRLPRRATLRVRAARASADARALGASFLALLEEQLLALVGRGVQVARDDADHVALDQRRDLRPLAHRARQA